ncbi:programmed cell death protein, putative [Entamoeba invadens IP1]|uniref:Programmed cell death protein, putative n=1 Tax=Entamoeba invadens IP1 TaxID=370355 RepID=A0A0A1UDE4_ENTIV|nr:programmed cell death protein, putative [Entamoeba invadens IP1]ELP91836.1 programmed cell death protein, putative [Entamoeba invadens IP1]|eukprot:XP_004258607.1 programmed cell death protein, putative [Entamoeba invadens IP1]
MSLFAIQAAADKYVADMIQAGIKQDPRLQFQWWFPLVESISAVEFHQNQDWFIKVDKDKSGTLDAKEIIKAKFPGDIKVDQTTVNRLMRIFDVDFSGSIGFFEFLALYNFVKLCLDTFKNFDKDKGGSLDAKELTQALPALGFNCSKRSIDILIKLNSALGKKISKNQFVAVAAYLGQCRSIYQRTFDMKRNEIDNREFDKFVNLVLSLVE